MSPVTPYTIRTCQGINGRFVCPQIAAVLLSPGFLGRYLGNPTGQRLFVWCGMAKKTNPAGYKEWYQNVYKSGDQDDFYESAEWRHTRRECLYRDKYICTRCDKRFRSEHLSVHHVIPRLEGGPDHLGNLVTLCSDCHDFVEINDLRSKALIIGSYEEDKKYRPEDKSKPDETNKNDGHKRPEWHKWVYGGCKRNPR